MWESDFLILGFFCILFMKFHPWQIGKQVKTTFFFFWTSRHFSIMGLREWMYDNYNCKLLMEELFYHIQWAELSLFEKKVLFGWLLTILNGPLDATEWQKPWNHCSWQRPGIDNLRISCSAWMDSSMSNRNKINPSNPKI